MRSDDFTKALGAIEFDNFSRCCPDCESVEAQGNASILNQDNERIKKVDKLGGSIMPARVHHERTAVAYTVVRKLPEDEVYCLCLLGQTSLKK